MQILVTNKNNYLLAGIGFFIVLYLLNATLLKPESDYPNIKHITPTEAFALISNNEDILILDVREKDAFNRAHIPKAIAVPIGDLKQRLQEFEKHKAKDIVVYCTDGSIRGPKATAMLNDAGYNEAKNLHGGLEIWRDNNYQIAVVQ